MHTAISNYQVFPRHVGKWSGTIRRLDANLQQTKSYKITQNFQQFEEKWVISNTYSYDEGKSETHIFDILPFGNGEVEVKTESPMLKSATMQAREDGESIIEFKIVNSETGKLQEIETITLISDSERVRTAQMFDQEGVFKGLLVIVESRVD